METNHTDDDSGQLARDGDYFLKRDRNKARTISIYTCEKLKGPDGRSSNQTVRVASADTSDPVIAEIALKRFVLNSKEAKQKERERQARGGAADAAIDRPVLEALQMYYLGHAEKKGGSLARCVRNAMSTAREAWPENPFCSKLDRDKQLEFIAHGRDQGWSDKTTSDRLGYVWTAMNWCDTGGKLGKYPRKITAEAWEANLESEKEPYTLEELAALFKAARRTDSHWRYMVCAVATGSRPTALLELTHPQVDLPHRICRLNPDGRRQTKKRRAVVPLCHTFFSELTAWKHDHDRYVIPFEGDRYQSTSFISNVLGPEAGIEVSNAMRIRRTVRTWLAEQDVPDPKADIFMGHAEEGSATGRRFYKKLKPGYLLPVAEAIEKLFGEIERLTRIPFAGSRVLSLSNQPLPEEQFATQMGRRIAATLQLRVKEPQKMFDNYMSHMDICTMPLDSYRRSPDEVNQ